MRRMLFAIVPVLMMVAALSGSPATAQDSTTLAVAADANLGAILTGADGMTVYLFTPDTTAGESACYDECAVNWPPVTAEGDLTLPEGVPGTLATIERTDGVTQVTYNDIPLYYWKNDAAAGDVTGQDVGGVWFVVAPGSALGPYAPAQGDGTPTPVANVKVGFTPELGPFLTDAAGMTLYLFTQDTEPGVSACYDDCAVNWPPLAGGAELVLPPGLPGALGSIDRTDGATQMTYNGMPLYYWKDDAAPGDTTGQGVGDVWFIVPPTVPDMGTPEAA